MRQQVALRHKIGIFSSYLDTFTPTIQHAFINIQPTAFIQNLAFRPTRTLQLYQTYLQRYLYLCQQLNAVRNEGQGHPLSSLGHMLISHN